MTERFYDDVETAEQPGEKTFLDSSELVLNMGPQHPSTHGVLRVILKLDGEKVMGSECVIGYLHRGVEKIAENRTYAQFAPYVDRMDYVAAVSNALGYCEESLTVGRRTGMIWTRRSSPSPSLFVITPSNLASAMCTTRRSRGFIGSNVMILPSLTA